MRRVSMSLCALCLLLTSCAELFPPPPQLTKAPPRQTTFEALVHPDVAYRHAYSLFAQQSGWFITWQDPAIHTFRGEVNHAAQMQVWVTTLGRGSLVSVSGSLLPNKQTTGEFTEVDDYARRLQAILSVQAQPR